jgi:hypothetical protein
VASVSLESKGSGVLTELQYLSLMLPGHFLIFKYKNGELWLFHGVNNRYRF